MMRRDIHGFQSIVPMILLPATLFCSSDKIDIFKALAGFEGKGRRRGRKRGKLFRKLSNPHEPFNTRRLSICMELGLGLGLVYIMRYHRCTSCLLNIALIIIIHK